MAIDRQDVRIGMQEAVVLFTIRPDGTLDRGPSFTTTDEMSLKFWDAVEEARRPLLVNQASPAQIAELVRRIAASIESAGEGVSETYAESIAESLVSEITSAFLLVPRLTTDLETRDGE